VLERVVGLTVAAAPVGRPVTAKLTVPGYEPPKGATASVYVAELPEDTVSVDAPNTCIVKSRPVTVKLCVTDVAAAKLVFPACEAVIEHVPAAINVRVLPDTLHTLEMVDVYETVRPELAVAVSVSGELARVVFGRAAKVIVCVVAVTAKLCVTGGAAA
jgi:hypothetical protein